MGGRLSPLLPLVVVVVVSNAAAAVVQSRCGSEATVFSFGDSNSDTGGLQAGLGEPVPFPNGRAFFGRPAGRYCDGRLIIDFLCESLNTRYLSPYLDSLGTDFRNGADFSISGAMTLPRDIPFSLHIQVSQFLRFKSRSLELVAQGSRSFIDKEGFNNALYVIDIGQNDLDGAFTLNLSYGQVLSKIPSILFEIKDAIKTLYNNGGKNFWVHNTGPLGCLPKMLSLLREDDDNLDSYGCLVPLNNAAKEFNAALSTLCNELNFELKKATVIYTDIYSVKYELIADYAKYGFKSPVMACCGYGGPPYNYNKGIFCGDSGYEVCPEDSRYISWDGIHYTEAANAIVASKIFSGDYSNPRVKFDYFCTSLLPHTSFASKLSMLGF